MLVTLAPRQTASVHVAVLTPTPAPGRLTLAVTSAPPSVPVGTAPAPTPTRLEPTALTETVTQTSSEQEVVLPPTWTPTPGALTLAGMIAPPVVSVGRTPTLAPTRLVPAALAPIVTQTSSEQEVVAAWVVSEGVPEEPPTKDVTKEVGEKLDKAWPVAVDEPRAFRLMLAIELTSEDTEAAGRIELGLAASELSSEDTAELVAAAGFPARELRADDNPRFAVTAGSPKREEIVGFASDPVLASTLAMEDAEAADRVALGSAASELKIEDTAGLTAAVGLAASELRAEDSAGSALATGFETRSWRSDEIAGSAAVPEAAFASAAAIEDAEAAGKDVLGSAAKELRSEDAAGLMTAVGSAVSELSTEANSGAFITDGSDSKEFRREDMAGSAATRPETGSEELEAAVVAGLAAELVPELEEEPEAVEVVSEEPQPPV
ncbi:hypothetical protein BDV97DRAFT_362802 [Delphinella strobiligena]|nr:hypothetical protein BDV97DRAFT_362802 [Delphinella strobiligena]